MTFIRKSGPTAQYSAAMVGPWIVRMKSALVEKDDGLSGSQT
jgi:hypothetical protein